ncbi:MAG: hypothetical protein M3Y51_07135 [Actinomycetota bacterium]|nr:hypothetical protein [Actinomycetota bacterium]
MNKSVQVVLMLGACFLVFAIWRDPATAAQDLGDLVGSLASWLQDVLSKFADFFSNLGS